MTGPLIIYDGACAFCEWWARYWQRATSGRLEIASFQTVAPSYPAIPEREFQRAVQYVSPEGRIASGAEASFLALSHARGGEFWTTLYRRLPGFAFVSERSYDFIAAHRPTFFRLTRLFWGREPLPPRFDLVALVFPKVIALIYLTAFVSFAVQAQALIGSEGILPMSDYLARIMEAFGRDAWLRHPTVFWLNASDAALTLVCWAGALAAVLLLLGVLPKLLLAILFLLYLSLFTVGQIFTIYQWDLLLLETGFIALLLATGSKIAVWLGRWLLFRLMFLSGIVKLASGDAAWWSLSALRHHFETQPLPTPLAWYAHHAAESLLAVAVVGTFVVELVLVFLIFTPRRTRFIAAWGIIALQTLILLTGNYSFFNLLVLALTLFLFDDHSLRRIVSLTVRERRAGPVATGIASLYAALAITLGVGQISAAAKHSRESYPETLSTLVAPLRIVNPYGAFAEIVTERSEVVIEGSSDGREWLEYEFKYKPGPLARAPSWNVPHQPRLDWQMWFAAIGNESRDWFPDFVRRLLQGSPEVLSLLAVNPFPDSPPKQVRAMLYQYRFTTPQERRESREWWVRQQTGIYYPQTSLEQAGAQQETPQKPLFESIIR